jgi:hypothetical protein
VTSNSDRRSTSLPSVPLSLSDEFVARRDKQTQWAAFVRRQMLQDSVPSFDQLAVRLRAFLLPMVGALVAGEAFNGQWAPGGPWL